MVNDSLKNVEINMQKALESFKRELGKVRTGRAHTSFVEGIKVDYYGNETTLEHVANIVISNAQTITVTPWEKNLVKLIEKAIASSDLGLNPISDLNSVKVLIPPLTEERRKEMIKMAKNIAEISRIAIRNIRREAMDKIKNLLKKKEINEDIEYRTQNLIQKNTDKFIEEIDKLAFAKEIDLMRI
ncbi:MAG: ribosome recycling factor [Coxiellaceae bacterium]|jgi:ribosome recycling factor|nr:ribosome recycling factor [Coxiellaceae bacterium]